MRESQWSSDGYKATIMGTTNATCLNATASDVKIFVAYVKAAKTPWHEAGQIRHPENMVPPNRQGAPNHLV
jgi:hypothetical protein